MYFGNNKEVKLAKINICENCNIFNLLTLEPTFCSKAKNIFILQVKSLFSKNTLKLTIDNGRLTLKLT